MVRSFVLSADLPAAAIGLAIALALLSLALVAWELWRHRQRALLVAASGSAATALLLIAVLRPARVASRDSTVGPRVLVLVDRSLSMALPGDDSSRERSAHEATRMLASRTPDARWSVLGFGEGSPHPFSPQPEGGWASASRSDLVAALSHVAAGTQESPSAIVVVSDGRLDVPDGAAAGEAVRQALGSLRVPVHTISASERSPRDAAIRFVKTAGAAVAHQPLTLTVELACEGGLSCGDIELRVRELVESGSPLLLASGIAHLQSGKGTIELPITLDRAGPRVVELAIDAPAGDEIPDNDRRLLTLDVTRDRVRILHIAGRPTHDVRALRQWLQSDASLDVVAFFILRTLGDDVNATPDELALIKFPVDELFSEHLASFDAVVLQDFPSGPYGLTPYFRNILSYVDKGGGLVMVGGLNAFSSGGYAGTPIETVLPVALPREAERALIDSSGFVPRYTAAGRGTPVLESLRGLLGDELPVMTGTNIVGDPHPGTVVLWEHPSLRAPSGAAMPVLALGEKGNGRTLALTLDDTHQLAFSESAARNAGRGFGLLWDALLGWLMRDPRYEPARIDLERPCRADAPTRLHVRPVPGATGPVEVTVRRLGTHDPPIAIPAPPDAEPGRSLEVTLPALSVGAYSVRVRTGNGPATRREIACERGGDEWADTRPDLERMRSIAKACRGEAVSWKDAGSLTFAPATTISAERSVSPVLPPWAWTVAAAALLGAHWIARRKAGLA